MDAQQTLEKGIAYCEKHMACEDCNLNGGMCINNTGKLIVPTHNFLEFVNDFNNMIKEIYNQ